MKEDSIEGIYDTLKQCALISKSAGGIGVHVHCIRARGSYIAGTNGTSNGIVPMLRVFNNTSKYVDQGGNKVCLKFYFYYSCHIMFMLGSYAFLCLCLERAFITFSNHVLGAKEFCVLMCSTIHLPSL